VTTKAKKATIADGKSLVMLMSNMNRQQAANQERTLIFLSSQEIQPQSIDEADPTNKELRNEPVIKSECIFFCIKD
jgi:hypothetical protein